MHSLVIRKRFQLRAYPAGCINDPSLIPEGDARSQGSASNLKLRTLLPDFQVFGKLLQLNYTKTHDKLYSLVNSIPPISVIVDRQFQGSLTVNQFWSYSFEVECLNKTLSWEFHVVRVLRSSSSVLHRHLLCFVEKTCILLIVHISGFIVTSLILFISVGFVLCYFPTFLYC